MGGDIVEHEFIKQPESRDTEFLALHKWCAFCVVRTFHSPVSQLGMS